MILERYLYEQMNETGFLKYVLFYYVKESYQDFVSHLGLCLELCKKKDKNHSWLLFINISKHILQA